MKLPNKQKMSSFIREEYICLQSYKNKQSAQNLHRVSDAASLSRESLVIRNIRNHYERAFP